MSGIDAGEKLVGRGISNKHAMHVETWNALRALSHAMADIHNDVKTASHDVTAAYAAWTELHTVWENCLFLDCGEEPVLGFPNGTEILLPWLAGNLSLAENHLINVVACGPGADCTPRYLYDERTGLELSMSHVSVIVNQFAEVHPHSN